ncbi:MAG: hypothetical protein ACE5IJ_10585, partial [Thermoplasmata archaeon]
MRATCDSRRAAHWAILGLLTAFVFAQALLCWTTVAENPVSLQEEPAARGFQTQSRSWSNSLFENFYGEPEIRDIELDSSSNLLFLATTYGLLIHNVSTGTNDLFTMADGLASHYVNALAYDSHNSILFLGTGEGLDILDVEQGTFSHRDLWNWSSDNRVQSLAYYDEGNRLFIGLGQSLIEYDRGTDSLAVLRGDTGVGTMAIDSHLGRLYFGPVGLNIYDLTNGTFDVRNTTHGLPQDGVTSIDMTADGKTVFVGSHGGGFSIYDVLTDSFQTVNSTAGLSLDYVWTVQIDEERHRLYLGVGTDIYLGLERHWYGLDIYDLQNESITNVNKSSGLSGNATLSMKFDDQRGKVYIGIAQTVEDLTDLPGLNVYDPSDGSVYSVRLGDGLPTTKPSRIAIDYERDTVYVGSTRGLAIMDRSIGTLEVRDVTDGLASNLVRGMSLDSLRGRLYLGGYEGLNIYNLTSDTFSLRNTSLGLPSDVVQCIFVDESSSLVYVGTLDGLSIYDSVTDSFTNLDVSSFPRASVCPLEMDYAGRLLYVGTGGGLGIYNTSTGEVVNKYEYDGLSYSAIQDVRVGPNGIAYIATADGFSIYDPDSDAFESMFSSDGLVNNLTYGVEVLYESGQVVVSAFGGFNFYDINTETFCCPLRDVDGLPSLTPSILEVDHENGYLYISSGGGLTRFDLTHVAPPKLVTPSSPDFDGSFQLTWTEIWNANEYALEQANSSSFDSPQIAYAGSNISVPISATAHGFYYFRVKATNWSLGDSDWSNTV